MTYYERSEIRKGLFMTNDGPSVFVKNSRPVRYGDKPKSSLEAVHERLAAARKRLDEIRSAVATTRRQN